MTGHNPGRSRDRTTVQFQEDERDVVSAVFPTVGECPVL